VEDSGHFLASTRIVSDLQFRNRAEDVAAGLNRHFRHSRPILWDQQRLNRLVFDLPS
jgi:hypothetical protein